MWRTGVVSVHWNFGERLAEQSTGKEFRCDTAGLIGRAQYTGYFDINNCVCETRRPSDESVEGFPAWCGETLG